MGKRSDSQFFVNELARQETLHRVFPNEAFQKWTRIKVVEMEKKEGFGDLREELIRFKNWLLDMQNDRKQRINYEHNVLSFG